MSHLDEGLLTALLDDELEETERRSAETHLAECAECRRLLEEVKAFATEADGLVAAVVLPPKDAPGMVPALPPLETPAGPTGRRSAGRPMPWRTLAWAASVVLAAGSGWLASDLHYGARVPELSDRTAETDRLAPAVDEPRAAAPAPTRTPSPTPLTGTALARKESAQSQPAVLQERANSATADRRPTPPATAKEGVARDPDGPGLRADQEGLRGFADAAAPAAGATGGVASRALESPTSSRLSLRREAGFRQIDMEEAVRRLGGSIRLVDGLQPERILIGPPSRGAGADSSFDLVRVVYQDPPGRELWLDQQRPAEEAAAFRARNSPGLLAGDTVFTRDSGGSASLRWVDQHGFRLALTGFLDADSMRALIDRIH